MPHLGTTLTHLVYNLCCVLQGEVNLKVLVFDRDSETEVEMVDWFRLDFTGNAAANAESAAASEQELTGERPFLKST